jgi:1,4-alpha-glucan branching enzyme
MGQEFAQDREWNHDASLDWELLERPRHQGVRRLVADLNRLYALQPALHNLDFEVEGFSWIDCHDSAQSVLSFIRRAGPAVAVVVLNFTPLPRFKYRIGVSRAGEWREAFNSDSAYYGGANVGNAGVARTEPHPWMEHPQSLELSLPPLGGIVLLPVA